MPIDPLTPVASIVPSAETGASRSAGGAAGFGDVLRQLMASVNATSQEANAAVSGMVDGTTDVHEALIALQRADLSLQLTVQIRNKIVQAYQDVMRMQV